MQVLWLRFLTEISEQTRNAPQELLDNPEVSKALTEVEESAFTDAELEGYDKFWDTIRVECTLVNSALRRYKEGWAKGEAEGRAKGEAEGEAKGEAKGKTDVARNLKQMGLPVDTIAQATGLTPEDIERL